MSVDMTAIVVPAPDEGGADDPAVRVRRGDAPPHLPDQAAPQLRRTAATARR
jgi:hypothetical protein